MSTPTGDPFVNRLCALVADLRWAYDVAQEVEALDGVIADLEKLAAEAEDTALAGLPIGRTD